MPLGKYKNFKACEKEHSKAYCGALYWKIHGKKKGSEMLKKEIYELKEEIEISDVLIELAKKDSKYESVRETENYTRKRRFDPSFCEEGKIRTKDLGNGKKAVVCFRKDTKKWDAQAILEPKGN